MDLSEDEIIQNYAKQCGHCNRKTLLPYEYELTCIVCGFNLINEKTNSLKYKEKKLYQSIETC